MCVCVCVYVCVCEGRGEEEEEKGRAYIIYSNVMCVPNTCTPVHKVRCVQNVERTNEIARSYIHILQSKKRYYNVLLVSYPDPPPKRVEKESGFETKHFVSSVAWLH